MPRRILRPLTIAASGLCALVILAYAILLPRGHWQGDEFITIALMRHGSWAFERYFFVSWSPRAISNALYATYGAAVNATGRPLITACLGLLWIALGTACLAPALLRAPRVPRALTGLAIFALFLVGHDVTEVFYWPGGGLSYLPTLAGAAWLFWCLTDGPPLCVSRQVGAALALCLIAGCSEVGIFLALTICACLAPYLFRPAIRQALWLLPGFGIAAVDLYFLLHGRVGTIEMRGPDAPTVHHIGASLRAAILPFTAQLLAPDTGPAGAAAVARSIVARLAIFLAARWAAPSLTPNRVPALLLPYAAALLLADFATIAASYDQFGVLCCNRHDTMRACFVCLSLVCLGAWSAGRWPPRAARPTWAEAAWVGAILLLFVPELGGLAADLKSMPKVVTARAQTWASGFSAGPDMVLTLEPQGRVVNANSFPTGTFTRDKTTAWYDLGILNFFNKDRLTVVKPAP
jgi:hypothetical protein